MRLPTIPLAALTLVAFAANSILCRMALASHSIGPLHFTVLRLVSGALVLLPVLMLHRSRAGANNTLKSSEVFGRRRTGVAASLALLSYALFFSLAYVQIDAAVGALILFAAVQITMIGVSILRGSRLTLIEWTGCGLAFAGLVFLLAPGLTAPPFMGAVMMLVAGTSWGAYSLIGKEEKEPILAASRNFLFCLPGCAAILIVTMIAPHSTAVPLRTGGVVLAIISGALTSGLGYVLWYLTLKRITTTVASISQLAVPVIAAAGGVAFLHEHTSMRLLVASAMILGGIVTTTLAQRHRPLSLARAD